MPERRVKEKPHRLPREHYLGRKATSFTARLRGWASGLDETVLVSAMVERLAAAVAWHGCNAPIYCFMPDHLHVLMLGETDASDAKAAMDRFKASTGWWLYRNRPELHWQKDYWDHIVRAREGWETQARYIAGNPVRAGLVADPFDYSFTGSIGYDVREIILDAHW